ncbi:unnamed protein product [Linum trigynum]|uniref:Uncharacterized protein n=1 Tax=Linum trigynum TaxID=586398 RepID=A0AAV2G5D9_9ROSI
MTWERGSAARDIFNVGDFDDNESSDEEEGTDDQFCTPVSTLNSGSSEEVNQPHTFVGSNEEDESVEEYIPEEATASTHKIRRVLDDEDPEELLDDLPFYDPNCDHRQLEFHVSLKFLN